MGDETTKPRRSQPWTFDRLQPLAPSPGHLALQVDIAHQNEHAACSSTALLATHADGLQAPPDRSVHASALSSPRHSFDSGATEASLAPLDASVASTYLLSFAAPSTQSIQKPRRLHGSQRTDDGPRTDESLTSSMSQESPLLRTLPEDRARDDGSMSTGDHHTDAANLHDDAGAPWAANTSSCRLPTSMSAKLLQRLHWSVSTAKLDSIRRGSPSASDLLPMCERATAADEQTTGPYDTTTMTTALQSPKSKSSLLSLSRSMSLLMRLQSAASVAPIESTLCDESAPLLVGPPDDWNTPRDEHTMTASGASGSLTASGSSAQLHSIKFVAKLQKKRQGSSAKRILRQLTHHNKALMDAGQLEDELNTMAGHEIWKLAMRNQTFLLIPIQSRFKMGWDVLMALLTFYSILHAPMDIAFDLRVEGPWLFGFQCLVDAILLLDVVFMFRTTYIDRTSLEEVHDTTLIRRRYLSGWFATDCLSSVPVTFFGPDLYESSTWSQLKYLRVCILFRALRVSKSATFNRCMAWIAHKMNVAHLRLVVMTLLYLVLHHYIACGYYMVIEYEEQLYAAHESSGDHHEAELPERWCVAV
ncbi:Aste57867_21399 [Aphanomyces stellatus]|uniref:Aste57867_21399 protein n=1 Tax=Aphanomyces stellatus TaxID=120398 RepID=A0A485LHG6_9STRA|nr:hypothetical protein As57867_021330 [Aphanomyces stellatus]VFT98070.1 Aste57867_21399 [Aphanomyces stellatus]